jgi:outer membrane protein assembly factor BamB
MPHGSQPRHLFGYASLAILLLADVAQAADWPQFLGPARNGISAESDLIQQWPADGPKVLWRVEGGAGMSGVAILNGRAVTLIQRDGDQVVLVLDANTGKTLQAVPVAPEFDNPMGAGPRATPALAGDRAYVYTGEGILAAVDVKDGKVVWSHDVVSELGGKPAEYGMACSPLLLGDQVIVTAGASRGTVAAFNAATGKPAWQAVAGNGRDTAGYSSPALLQVADEQQLVAFEGKAAIGLAPATGKLLWRYPT